MQRSRRSRLHLRLQTSSLSRGLVLSAVLLLAGEAAADIVELNDGRTFEGRIIKEDATRIRMDAKVGNARVSLGFARDQVKSVEKRALPPGFFEPPPADSQVSDPSKMREGAVPFLEVPVIGILGKDTFAEGIVRAIAYAASNGIQHVVFVIDSAGGEQSEGRELYRALQRNRDKLTYHALVRTCQGPALAVAAWCDTVQLLPGGKIGGRGKSAEDGQTKEDAEEQSIVWSQLAYRVLKETGRTGRSAQILEAMIDPAVHLAAWTDDAGQGHVGPEPPQGTPPDRIIFRVGEGEVLVLTYDQTIKFGMKPFEGGAQELGAVLGIDGWTPESDYGRKIVERIDAERKKKAKTAQAAFESKVQKNVSKREETADYIQNCIKEAASWDPTKGSYETYSRYWNWGWGYGGDASTTEWTKESQQRWKNRTDACAYYLNEAGKALMAMKRLDAEAVKLGLQTTFKAGEIDSMVKDLQVRLGALSATRGRTGN